MIIGMTGFGSAIYTSGKLKLLVEIRSVNHRFLDINYYLPMGFNSMEDKIRQIVQTKIKRGRVTVSIKVVQKPEETISMNKVIIKEYINQSQKVAKVLHLKNDLTMAQIMRLPGVVSMKDVYLTPEGLSSKIYPCINRALGGLTIMRKREGKSLVADVKNQLTRMSLQAKKIKQRLKVFLKDKQSKLSAEEYRSLQKGSDINEELTRLLHYIAEIMTLLKGTATDKTLSVGKKIDFIAQEMQREVNTIGSKFQDMIASNSVIALKSKIEKIREQSQNVE